MKAKQTRDERYRSMENSLSPEQRRELVDQFLIDYRVPERILLAKRPKMVRQLRRAGYGGDISGECYLGLVRASEMYNPAFRVKFSSYVFHQQVWRCIRILEKTPLTFRPSRDREEDGKTRPDGDWWAKLVARESSPVESAEKAELSELAVKTVRPLVTPRQWRVLRLLTGVGGRKERSLGETADHLGVSHQAVSACVQCAADRVHTTITPRAAQAVKEARRG